MPRRVHASRETDAEVAAFGCSHRISVFSLFMRSYTLWQVDELDDSFFAVERCSRGNGYSRICRHGFEKILLSVPSLVLDVHMQGLDDRKFLCPVWRDRECATGAGLRGVKDGLRAHTLIRCPCS
jgi:hypothetical protein